MTPAEAMAALQVLSGGSVAQMADRLQVSVNTFKSQLAAAYAKTMSHRQTDLLKLLLSLSRR
jgi:DNA-binding CsgD family transcriptional regulator